MFVDTSALLAVLDEDDVRHAAAAATFRALLDGSELVTHNYIHVEASAIAGRRLGAAAATQVIDALLPVMTTYWVDEADHRAAVEAHRADDSGASFVDHVSFVVMRRLGIDVAFAFDADFATRGFVEPAVGEARPARRLSEAKAPYESSRVAGDLVSVAEIAARSGRSPNTVQSWRRRHRDFPTPVAMLAAAPVWAWPDVAAWIDARAPERLPLPSRWGRTATGEPMPNVVEWIRSTRDGH